MKTITLEGAIRHTLGKSAVKQLRKTGYVPCALYDDGQHVVHFSLPEKELRKAIYTPDTLLIVLSLDGKNYNAIIREVQFQAVHDNIEHVDFVLVRDDKPVTAEMPVKLVGTSPGVLAGGKLVQKMRKMRIRGNYTKFPDYVTIDVSGLKLGRSLKIRELTFPDFTVLNSPDVPVASIEIPRALRQEMGRTK